MAIQIINGCLLDALENKHIAAIGHCANMQNTFGSGVAKSIRERFPPAYFADGLWYNGKRDKLHSLAMVGDNRFIFNLYGQVTYGRDKRQVNYGLIAKALSEMAEQCFPGLVIGFPYLMACDRAGGDWQTIYEMIEVFFSHCEVKIYRLEKPI